MSPLPTGKRVMSQQARHVDPMLVSVLCLLELDVTHKRVQSLPENCRCSINLGLMLGYLSQKSIMGLYPVFTGTIGPYARSWFSVKQWFKSMF